MQFHSVKEYLMLKLITFVVVFADLPNVSQESVIALNDNSIPDC